MVRKMGGITLMVPNGDGISLMVRKMGGNSLMVRNSGGITLMVRKQGGNSLMVRKLRGRARVCPAGAVAGMPCGGRACLTRR